MADTAKAVYAVDDYHDFVGVHAESALRHVANGYPYEDTQGSGISLRGSTDVVASQLALEVAARVAIAGVEVVEVRISHLAYAAEIAQAMLRAAGQRGGCCPLADCRGRRRDGGDGADATDRAGRGRAR